MEIAIAWFLFACVVGFAAAQKGRSGALWFLFALVLSPLIVGLFLLVAPSLKDRDIERARNTGVAGDYRKCPECAEVVRREARKCKHCGSALEPAAAHDPWYAAGKTAGQAMRSDEPGK